MRGGGGAATLAALPTPLGSTVALFIPPAFAGPCAIPLIGTFPAAAEPALRANCANEAAGAAATTAGIAIHRCEFSQALGLSSAAASNASSTRVELFSAPRCASHALVPTESPFQTRDSR